jgi:polar amino acid transport system permease protein
MLDIIVRNYAVLLGGLGMTLGISAVAIAAGGLLGVAIALGLRARSTVITRPCRLYRSFWRGTPIFVQLLMIFYLLPEIGLMVAPVVAAVLALALNSAAFQAEIFRAGLAALPRGQVEAARILGIGRIRTLLRIELPQMLRLVLPALVSEIIAIVKNSSLVSVIAVTELTRRGQQIASTTFRPLEVYILVGLLYLAVNIVLARAGQHAERRLARSGALQ